MVVKNLTDGITVHCVIICKNVLTEKYEKCPTVLENLNFSSAQFAFKKCQKGL